jgi:methylated-DNA-[protein]-cysteine S-methyltransferase
MPVSAIETPLGLMSLDVSGYGVRRLYFTEQRPEDAASELTGLALQVQQQLIAYFEGTRFEFDLPLDFDTGSEFQQRCWQVIAAIPYGACVSYGEVAWAAGRPGAARAAGTACANTPIDLLVPCHRVIAADGRLGGYGARERKIWLLKHEGMLNKLKGFSDAAVAHREGSVV